MANKKSSVNKAIGKAGATVSHQDKLTRALIKAGSPKVKKTAKNSTVTYRDFLDMSPQAINKLTRDELRAVVARLNKVESKRVKNLEKYGYNTQAVRALNEAGGKTKASKDMTRQELLHEYKRAKAFLLSETSTVAGSKTFISDIASRVGAERELSNDEITRLYDLVDKHKDEAQALLAYTKGNSKSVEYQYSVKVQKKVWELMDEGKSDDEILTELNIMSRTEYEARQDTSTDYNFRGYHRP